MTMRTRSSANYSHHVPTSTTTTATTIPAASLSVVDTNAAFSSSGTDVDDIMAAKNEAIQKLMRSYRAHLHEKFVSQSLQWLKKVNATSTQIDDIMASFHINAVNVDLKVDETVGEGCTVFSPVKKKQKSNDYASSSNSSTTTSVHDARGNRKVLLPPKASTKAPSQNPIVQKYSNISHGLSIAELARIESLKKNDLIAEIDRIDGEFHKSWTKPMLVDTLLRTYASFHQPDTQAQSMPSITLPPTAAAVAAIDVNDDNEDDVMVVDAPMTNSSTENDIHVEMARTTSADKNYLNYNHHPSDANENMPPPNTAMLIDTDAMLASTAAEPSKHIVSQSDNNDAVTEFPPQIEQVSSMDSDDTHYDTARENLTESQSMQQQQNSNMNALVLTKQYDNHSSMDVAKQPQKTRVSPNTVPAGIVDSAKKALLLSSQKKTIIGRPYQVQNVTRVLYKDQPQSSTAASSGTTSAMIHPSAMVYAYESVSMNTSNSISHMKEGTHRILSTPAYNSNGSSTAALGMSQTVQAFKEAREARVAKMKEKSQQTLSSSKTFTMSQDKSTLSSNSSRNLYQSQPKQQNLLHLTTSTPAVAVHQLAAVDTVKSKPNPYQNPVYSIKSKPQLPSKQPEFTSYEMTDGEYDSDDDEDDDVSESNKKMIPDWARSRHLEKALEIQFSKNYPIDPDDLFGEVETCNLEAIFDKKSLKYRTRNSSGDWANDRVTAEEKRWYKAQIA